MLHRYFTFVSMIYDNIYCIIISRLNYYNTDTATAYGLLLSIIQYFNDQWQIVLLSYTLHPPGYMFLVSYARKNLMLVA